MFSRSRYVLHSKNYNSYGKERTLHIHTPVVNFMFPNGKKNRISYKHVQNVSTLFLHELPNTITMKLHYHVSFFMLAASACAFGPSSPNIGRNELIRIRSNVALNYLNDVRNDSDLLLFLLELRWDNECVIFFVAL